MSKEIKYVIKNVETNEYFTGWQFAVDAHGKHILRDPISNKSWGTKVYAKSPIFSKQITPKLYNTHGGAQKIISEFAGISYASNAKLNPTQKVLFGNKDLTKYEIVPVKLKLVEVKS